MASGWDPVTKKVVRFNGRNSGPTIWDSDAISGQVIDSQGHDTNDQLLADSITDTLNINGINAMGADLDFGGFKGLALADGVNPADAVNKSQLDAVSQGGVTGQSWDGEALTLNTTNGNFETNFLTFTNFRSAGPIKHRLNETATVNVSLYNRSYVSNNNGVTINFSGMPAADDPVLGNYYQVEGQVLVYNTGTPGAVTTNITPDYTLGAPSNVANEVSILTYLMQWQDTAVVTTFIWSAD